MWHGAVHEKYTLFSETKVDNFIRTEYAFHVDDASTYHVLRSYWEPSSPFPLNSPECIYPLHIGDVVSGPMLNAHPSSSTKEYPLTTAAVVNFPPMYEKVGSLAWIMDDQVLKDEWFFDMWGPKDRGEFHCVHWEGGKSFLSFVLRPIEFLSERSKPEWKRHTSIHPPELQAKVEAELGVSLDSLTEVEYVIPLGSSNPTPSR